jgi:hypothetical protein
MRVRQLGRMERKGSIASVCLCLPPPLLCAAASVPATSRPHSMALGWRRLGRPLALVACLVVLLLTVLPPPAPTHLSLSRPPPAIPSVARGAYDDAPVAARRQAQTDASDPSDVGATVWDDLAAAEVPGPSAAAAAVDDDFYSGERLRPFHARAFPCGPALGPYGVWAVRGRGNYVVTAVSAPCLWLDGKAVSFAQRGGEALAAAQGQREEVEYPGFAPGWLAVGGGTCATETATGLLPVGMAATVPDHLPRCLGGVQLLLGHPCAAAAAAGAGAGETPPLVLMIMRYEYVNMYHTLTDWFNAVDALAMVAAGTVPGGASLRTRAVQVVFLDAHPAGSLDATWTALFGRRPLFLAEAVAQQLRMDHVVFVAPGYQSPITAAKSAGSEAELPSRALQRFGRYMLLRHGLAVEDEDDDDNDDDPDALGTSRDGRRRQRPHPGTPRRRVGDVAAIVAAAAVATDTHSHVAVVEGPSGKGGIGAAPPRWVTVVLRGDYRPHPRHNGQTTRKIANERALLDALAAHVAAVPSRRGGGEDMRPWAVRGVHLEAMSVRDQLALFHSSDAVVSVHGAALSLVVAMRPGTLVVELQPPAYMRPHFRPMARAAGLRYAVEPLANAHGDGPYHVNADAVAAAIALHMHGT